MLHRLRDNLVARRVASGTGANLLGKLWVFASQIVMIPLLTQHWGADGYGLWLLVSTVPAYVLLGDFGIAPTLAPSLSKALASGDKEAASTLLKTGWIVLSCLVVVIALLTSALGWTIAATGTLAQTSGGSASLAITVGLMALYAIAIAQMNLVNAVYRATYRYAFGTIALDILVLVELVTMGMTVLVGGELLAAAWVLLTTRAIGLVLYYRHAVRLESWASLTRGSFSLPALRQLLLPSLAAFAITLANTFTFHALIVAIGAIGGPAVVAVFGATRVLTRAPLQFAGLLSRATVPELTRASLEGNLGTMRRLVWVSVGTSLLVSVPSSVLIVVAGPVALQILTGSTLSPPLALIMVLALAATLNAAWSGASVLLVAQNKLSGFAYAYAFASAIGVALTLFSSASTAAMTAAASMVLAELVALAAVLFGTRAALSKADHA